MRKKNSNRSFYIIGGIIILILAGIVIIFFVNKNQKSSSNNTPPSEKNPAPNPNGKLSEQEIEKYLLEKRLDLQKYFVFNLGKEVETREKVHTEYVNYRSVKGQLENDLSKLAVKYRNKLKEEGKKVVEGTHPKKIIVFLGKTFEDLSDEWTENKFLDQKIANGNSLFIIFEKDNNFEKVYFPETKIDQEGNSYFPWNNWIRLPMKSPTTTICESKEKALEIIKTDPALAGKV